MATRHRELPRLNIPAPLHMQQTLASENRQAAFSPAFPSSVQQNFQFPSTHPLAASLATPMQLHSTHLGVTLPSTRFAHQARPSMAAFNPVGINMNGITMSPVPMTPMAQNYIPPQVGNGSKLVHPFAARNKRSASICLGGPPKAVLGGPNRKLSPLPRPVAHIPNAGQTSQGKKVTVNLPKETYPEEDGQPVTRPEWARVPQASLGLATIDAKPPELTSVETYPPDSWARHFPKTLEVFLPGKVHI